jgi:hypothetical protein
MMGTHDATAPRQTLFGLGLAGGTPRTASLALYSVTVPEPTSFALIGCALGVLFVRLASARPKLWLPGGLQAKVKAIGKARPTAIVQQCRRGKPCSTLRNLSEVIVFLRPAILCTP